MRAKQNKKKLIIAIAAGVFASLIMFSTMGNLNKQIQEQSSLLNKYKKESNNQYSKPIEEAKVIVVVAKNNLAMGTRLTPEMMEAKPVIASEAGINSIKDMSIILGKTIMENLILGQPITRDMIKEFQNKTLDIPPGMRAITIPAEYIQGYASYMNIGSKIDIILAAKIEEGSNLIVQNVKIIAFENGIRPQSDTGIPASTTITAITFQVPANSAPKIVEAMVKGKIQVVARNNNDNEHIAIVPKTKKSNSTGAPPIKTSLPPFPIGASLPSLDNLNKGLSGLPAPAAPPKKTKPPKKVEFIQANVKSDLTFDNWGSKIEKTKKIA